MPAEEMKKIGKTPSSKVLDFEVGKCNEKLAKKMNLNVGDKIYIFTRLRLADDEPMMVETSYVPYDRFPGLTRKELEEHAMYDIFTKKYNVRFTYAEETFQSVLTREDEADLLNYSKGLPSMVIERITYENRNVIEYAKGIVRGENLKFLRINGGGTKTDFLVIDDKGKVLAYTSMPTCHYIQTSLDNFESVIRNGIEKSIKVDWLSPSQIDYTFAGIPGYGEIEKDMEVLNSIVGKALSSSNYKCGNDSEAAWAGSLACQPGVIIVAGTGAIGFGVDANGNMARASGWGPFCGDEGSAYWLGYRKKPKSILNGRALIKLGCKIKGSDQGWNN